MFWVIPAISIASLCDTIMSSSSELSLIMFTSAPVSTSNWALFSLKLGELISTTGVSLLNFVHRTFFAALISSHCFDALFGLCSSSRPLGEQGWSLNVLCLMEMGMAYEGGWWGSYRGS